jgi:ABC-type dipeptide/oligopeptide/nickel transport system ATPase component
MALSCHPSLLIADEPTTALDVTIQAQIMELLAELQEKLGLAVLLITHDLGVVAEFVGRVLVMYTGKIVEEAPVANLFKDPEGAVPDLARLPEGCHFAPRCPLVKEVCREGVPDFRAVASEHTARCVLY